MEPIDGEELYATMLALEGDTIALQVNREPRSRATQPALTFSREAMDYLRAQMIVWVGSRMARHFQATGQPVHDLEVEVRVKTTGSVLEPGVEPRVTVRFQDVLDGSHARAARKAAGGE